MSRLSIKANDAADDVILIQSDYLNPSHFRLTDGLILAQSDIPTQSLIDLRARLKIQKRFNFKKYINKKVLLWFHLSEKKCEYSCVFHQAI
jgi:hypothetical protein